LFKLIEISLRVVLVTKG